MHPASVSVDKNTMPVIARRGRLINEFIANLLLVVPAEKHGTRRMEPGIMIQINLSLIQKIYGTEFKITILRSIIQLIKIYSIN
jgi:hypothetical protein